ncbi:Heptaprenyl diphosphate synthase component I [hydrothermal vent metagenome]|uniref:Heptaprenyl diphosphate synthase component I n=1 Tax=hydrothermal vent metagenome TaxID=652676 RepID=A0A3B1AWV0_9ZZZZ
MTQTIQTTRDDHLIAWFTALAITIHIAESALPSPLPGVKPGLANVVTLIVLCRYGWRMAVWVALLRVLIGSVLLGTFLSPTFFLSLSGALASVAALGLGWAVSRAVPGWALGPLGFGLLAALAHMTGQFWAAYALFIPHPALLHLFPPLMTLAAVLGIVSGVLTRSVLARLNSSPSTSID